jgi:hypothetical protein
MIYQAAQNFSEGLKKIFDENFPENDSHIFIAVKCSDTTKKYIRNIILKSKKNLTNSVILRELEKINVHAYFEFELAVTKKQTRHTIKEISFEMLKDKQFNSTSYGYLSELFRFSCYLNNIELTNGEENDAEL